MSRTHEYPSLIPKYPSAGNLSEPAAKGEQDFYDAMSNDPLLDKLFSIADDRIIKLGLTHEQVNFITTGLANGRLPEGYESLQQLDDFLKGVFSPNPTTQK